MWRMCVVAILGEITIFLCVWRRMFAFFVVANFTKSKKHYANAEAW